MSDSYSPEQSELEQLSPQEQLESVWRKKENWMGGMNIEIAGLPEGMQAIETEERDRIVLKSVMPNLPETLFGKPLRNVPIASFHAETTPPEEIIGEARKFTLQVLNNEVTFVPPTFNEEAA